MTVVSSSAGRTGRPEAAPDGVTSRSVVLGVVTVILASWYISYHGPNLVKTFLPVAAVIPFVAWVGGNTLFKLVLPRRALSRGELLTLFSMLWVAGSLPAIGWATYAVSTIAGPEYFASPENRLHEVVAPALPQWLFLDARDPQVRGVFHGLAPGASIPWGLWFRPFYWWFVGCASTVMAGFFCSVLFYRQWHEKERLNFPMASFPIGLLEEQEEGRSPAVFRDRLFWIGFCAAAGVIAWNILGYFWIGLPRITLFDQYLTKAVKIGRHFPDYYLRVQPMVMGLAYLCPLDILFSVWSYQWVTILKSGLINQTGFTVGLRGQPAPTAELLSLESHGVLTFFVGWSIWVARSHLRDTWEKAFRGKRRADDGSPISYRAAWLGFFVSTAILACWCLSAGMSPIATGLQLTLVFICFFGIAKAAATTGFTFLNPPGRKGGHILRAIVGKSGFSPSTQAMLVLINRSTYVGTAIRTSSLPSLPHVIRMLGGGRGRGLILAAVALAYLSGFVSSAGFYLNRCYTEGGINGMLVSWPMDELVRQIPYMEGTRESWFDVQKFGVWLFGGGEGALLTWLRSQVAWWPFHPIAIAFPTFRYGFSLLLVWLVKGIVLRYGGAQLYRRSLPCAYGVTVGYVTGVALSSVVDAIWFPDGGHFVHGW